MDNLIKKFLDKQGIEDVTKLTPEEKSTYAEWEKILDGQTKITDVADWLEKNIKSMNVQLREAVKQGEDRVALLLTARLENYEAIAMMIREPDRKREDLQAYINSKL
jgi:dihydroorotate dehydrogenase